MCDSLAKPVLGAAAHRRHALLSASALLLAGATLREPDKGTTKVTQHRKRLDPMYCLEQGVEGAARTRDKRIDWPGTSDGRYQGGSYDAERE
jgi:hypothetical protein